MANLKLNLVLVALVAICGCNQSTPGGPGASEKPTTGAPSMGTASTAHKPATTTTTDDSSETFKLSLPNLATHVKQGETKDVTISISRGKNFDEDVALMLEGVPAGVTVEPASPMIAHGETEVKLTLAASDAAAAGNFTVDVTGHPAKGADAKGSMKVTVDEKK